MLTTLGHGRIGETYLVGADGEKDNKTGIELILTMTDRPASCFHHVTDRVGNELRYAIDSTKMRNELGWQPNYQDFEEELFATISWYGNNEAGLVGRQSGHRRFLRPPRPVTKDVSP